MPEVRVAPEVLSWQALEGESMDTPHPVSVILCGVCGLPWELHQELAERRLGIAEEDEDSYLAFTDDQVTFQDCVHLLLMTHPGFPGRDV